MAAMLKGFEKEYDSIVEESKVGVTKPLTQKAKKLRIDISKVRIETEKRRKTQKEEYLRAGKAIDGVSNILKWAVSEKEEFLMAIEKHFELQEKLFLEEVQRQRADALRPYVSDNEEILERDFSSMKDDVWIAYLNSKKKELSDIKEAHRKAEEERLQREKKQREEQELMRKENERLKKEATERAAKEHKERAEYEKKLRAERAEREKIQRELKEKREKEVRELAEREAKEAREKAEIEEREQAELRKGDSDKINDLITDLIALKTKYTFRSNKSVCMYKKLEKWLDDVIARIRN